jgi:CSLREA domain-containing protein/LPXTG-motif cell wall-anchored protein
MRHSSIRLILSAILLASLVFTVVPTPNAQAATFTVNSTADAVDATPGNGVCATAGAVCTLRAAIQEANALAGDDIITVPAGTFTLTIAGTGEELAATGDLDIRSNITINGAGAGTSIIDGGALDRVFHIITGTSTVNISSVTIRNGATTRTGGGIHNVDSTLTITNSTLSGNSSTGDGGGALFTEAGIVNISNTTFSNNSATGSGHGGGAILAIGGILNVSTSVISNNTAAGDGGGGITSYVDSGTPLVTISNTTVSSNTVTGIFADGAGVLSSNPITITASTIANNQNNSTAGGGNGGGMSHSNEAAVIINTTFSGNSAKGNGGGIVFNDPAMTGEQMTLNNVTIYNNTSDSDSTGVGSGGGIYVQSGATAVKFSNTIIAGNIDNTATAPDCSGDMNSLNYNLIQTVTGCNFSGTTTNNITGQNPNLAALASNGGSTQTHALQSGSPAIDKGNPAAPGSGGSSCAGTDQRGTTRPVGTRCDIGAYEGGSATVSTCFPDASFNGSTSVNNGSAYYLNCFYGQIHVNTYGNHYTGPATITSNGTTVCIQVPAGYEAIAPTCFTDKDGGRKDFYIRLISSAPKPITINGFAVGASGGTFNCDPWVVVIPAGAVPNGSVLQCSQFASSAATNAPGGFKLLSQTLNVIILDSNGNSLKTFNPTLQICYSTNGYTAAELAQANNDPKNFVVLTSQIGGTYSALPTTVDTTTRRVCGITDHLTLFEISVRTPTQIPSTGDVNTPWWLLAAALAAGGALGWLATRRKAF